MVNKNMKKILVAFCGLIIFMFGSGFDADDFNIDHFDTYEKEFESVEIEFCENTSAKTYMPYQAVTKVDSAQYKQIHEKMTVDETTGLLYDKDGFIGAALASYFGPIGSRYYFTLESGSILPIVKVDSKSDDHTNGCTALNGHLIEFVIDAEIAKEYFGQGPSGLASYGNFNNDERFEGKVIKFEKVLDEKIDSKITYIEKEETESNVNSLDIFGGY